MRRMTGAYRKTFLHLITAPVGTVPQGIDMMRLYYIAGTSQRIAAAIQSVSVTIILSFDYNTVLMIIASS